MGCLPYSQPPEEKCNAKLNLHNTAYIISIEEANRAIEASKKQTTKRVIGAGRYARIESMLNLLV